MCELKIDNGFPCNGIFYTKVLELLPKAEVEHIGFSLIPNAI